MSWVLTNSTLETRSFLVLTEEAVVEGPWKERQAVGNMLFEELQSILAALFSLLFNKNHVESQAPQHGAAGHPEGMQSRG